jgi:hypothetical protein
MTGPGIDPASGAMAMRRGASRLQGGGDITKMSGRRIAALAPVLLLHVSALILLVATERSVVGAAAFLLTWVLLNCLFLIFVRRPIVAVLTSLEILFTLTLLSRFKFDKLWMTVDFVDVMIVDRDTTAFLLALFPSLRWWIAGAAAATIVVIAASWRFDRHRVRPRVSLAAFAASAAMLITISLLWPTGLNEDFEDRSYVSKFARTGVEAIHEFMTRGYLDVADAPVEQPAAAADTACIPSRKLPHIILLHDESSFDLAAASEIAVPTGYHRHFESFDGKSRKLFVEGVGGPSWFTEFNVLTGLSVRSFGRFATSVTRIAAGHVYRGLPRTLSDCGYQTFSLYPFYGSFIGSRAFQTTAGIAHYMDMRDLGTSDFEADKFYYDRAVDLISREHSSGPLFLYVYTVANHFPWDKRLRPELTADWHDLGNPSDVEEYIRRQSMSAHDYRQLLKRLALEFPTDTFLIVRYGDHQPQFAPRLLGPSPDATDPAKRAEKTDLHYRTTYYAIDAVNFTPADMTSALDGLDASFLPLLTLQAAGVPLDASFSSQSAILQRCGGRFYSCRQGEEARRFNRLLRDGGLIKGL